MAEASPKTARTPAEMLAERRGRIDELTGGILGLANERARVALDVGAAKVAEGRTTVRDPEREKAVLDAMVAANDGPMTEAHVRRLGKTLMDITSELQVEQTGLLMGEIAQPDAVASEIPLAPTE